MPPISHDIFPPPTLRNVLRNYRQENITSGIGRYHDFMRRAHSYAGLVGRVGTKATDKPHLRSFSFLLFAFQLSCI
jgi:hypothetical protein